jgi:predicted nuclease of predicted toxin-antitoxin system
MLVRLLIDQDFDHDILRGLMRRVPDLDVVTTHEAGLGEAPDRELLDWAAQSGRIVVTHDRKTMPQHAAARIAAGERMCGVFVVPPIANRSGDRRP